jgi:predicted NUDIX family NTP pyrophosphohydrolase
MNTSAGLLMYRRRAGPDALAVLLAHPGGPFFRNKDDGAWSLPKGELEADEDALACARREFREETGIEPGETALFALGEVRQKGGKRVLAWAFEAPPGELDLTALPACNTFELEWPPKSGKRQSFPEIDKLAFFTLAEARRKILSAQVEFLDRLAALLSL